MKQAILVLILWPFIARADDLQTDMLDSLDRASKRFAESTGKVDGYKPAISGNILDLKTDAVALLKGLPYVDDARSIFKAGQPKRRIIVFQNLHTTDHETFVSDVEHERGRKLTEREAILEYWYLLSEVEAIQAEQMAALRCLIRHHGLTEAYQEGVATGELAAVNLALIASNVRAVNKLPGDWQRINADHLKLLKLTKPSDPLTIIEGMLTIHEARLPMLEAGALFRLYVADELKRVLPCEDETALDAAAPRFEEGKPVFDSEAVEARQDAIVANVLRGGPVAVLLLGASHDLRDNVKRLAPDAELITVRVESVPALFVK